MHDRRDTGRGITVPAEDVDNDELPADETVDDEHLRAVLRESRRYLPPPTLRLRRKEPSPPHEPEPAFARRAKLIGLIVAIALLVGSIAAAALLADDHGRDRSFDPAERPEITGVAALGGFVLPAQRRSVPHVRPAAVGDADPAEPATTPTGQPADGDRIALRAAHGEPAQPAAHSEPEPFADGISTVRRFYELVAERPREALALLDPAPAGREAAELVRAWSAMDTVRVDDLAEHPGGVVRAVVTMVPPDGKPLRVTQLLTLSEGPDTRIRAARLVATRGE
ncbi:hypothetical protein B0I33_113201 [Prauserella shujinwangii]|uniref:Uncharacterized protein n=1 Tax=Prauserella shujinwangii TaxID=1453103 RepID=A0A2T0LLX4_9PSEU|nr:hypothetical protein [Prauserella shujinwangii]PRX44035.1 hypothetical protein B0I33_113201 [Prauserella shujinwangii]